MSDRRNNYKEKLRLLADLTVEYGLDLLEKMSHEEETIPTKVMAEKLFNEHEQLADVFGEKYHIKTIAKQPEDIDEWLDRIKKMLMDSADSPYEEVKELLVKIAAFMGEKLCEMCSYEWLFPAHFEAPEVVGKYPSPKFMPLNIVVDAWKNKCNAQCWKLMEIYGEVLKKGITK